MSTSPAGLARLSRPATAAAGPVSWRVVLLAGRAEAARLCRSPLVLAGLLVAGVLIWWNSRAVVPQWPVWDVQIGSALLALAGAVLVATHLAASRVRRDAAQQLYESYPVPAAARTAGHLLGLAGPLALAAALTGVSVLWLDLLGPVGSPRLTALAQGLLLVVLAGAGGVALGTFLPHPMAGIVAATVLGAVEADLLLPSGGPVQAPGAAVWLFPWAQPGMLGYLPGPVPVFPPPSHLAWLAALAALAAVLALSRDAWRTGAFRLPALLTVAVAGSLAVAGWSGWDQLRPLPAGTQYTLVHQITHAAQAEQCVHQPRVSYCFYPEFRPDVARWAAAVNGVLGRVPGGPAAPLVVRQVIDADVLSYPPLAGQPGPGPLAGELNQFLGREADDPRLIPGSSVPPVYVDLNWGAGGALGSYQLSLTLQTAWWVVGLPTTWRPAAAAGRGAGFLAQAQTSCLPAGQAREAIALWLAAAATPGTRAAFPAALRYGPVAAKVAGHVIASYVSVPVAGYSPAVQFTAQGATLAQAMLRLPARRVLSVLSAHWPGWLRPRATDAQLAAALGVPLPSVPPPAPPRLPNQAGRPVSAVLHPAPRADPVCT